MAANQNTGVRAGSRSSLISKDEQKGDSDHGEEEISFAQFEKQWRRYLTNFERRRLQYIHKQSTLYGGQLSAEGQLDVGMMDFDDPTTIYDAQYNLSHDTEP